MEVVEQAKVHLLSDSVINQIAAGEVIENPASVVKELVENSLDAGAKRIAVEIKGGGLQLIRVIDDGSGMSQDDALLSLERHATSKISAADELFSLQTMGFRGEALASIAAISQLTLLTASKEGVRIEVKGGKILSSSPCARTRGTTIEVRSLFYNVPARKQFQKSAVVCTGEISRILTALALAHPNVGFELIQQDEALLSAEPIDLHGRIGQVLGPAFADALLPAAWKEEGIAIKGYIGKPEESRRNRSGQYLFINGRSVVSPPVSFAVRDGYSAALPEGRHPIFVLHLTLKLDLVDVNVHPQKREVRIREEAWLQGQIRRAVAEALQEKKAVGHQHPLSTEFSLPPLSSPFETELLFKEEERAPKESPELPMSWRPNSIGVFTHFFLVEEQGELVMIDLSAACARVAFEQLLYSSEIAQQTLLIPLSLELPRSEAALVQAHLAHMERLGISIRQLGSSAFIIDAHPPYIDPDALCEIVVALAEDLEKAGEKHEQKSLAERICRYPRKRAFSIEEAQGIYKALLHSAIPGSTPDGRPTMVRWKPEELAVLIKARGSTRV